MSAAFINHFFRNPTSVGAITPLSDAAIAEMIKGIEDRPVGTAWNILEVGAGLGNISTALAELLHPDDKLDLIEIDPTCCEHLKKDFEDDRRINVICASVLDWKPKYKYNLIVSTLPLNNFELPMVKAVFDHYVAISKAPALCSYVEYMALEKIKDAFSGKELKPKIEERRKFMKELHEQFLLIKEPIFRNFLPCNVYHLQLQKKSDS